MDTNVLTALIVALSQQKSVAVAPVVVSPVSNSIQIVTLILAALAPVLSALAIYLVRVAMAKVDESKKEILELKENVDGKMSKLLEATSRASHEEGKTAQRTESALVEQAHTKGIIEQLKANPTQPEVVHQVVSQEIKEQNVDTQTVDETLRKNPPKTI